MIRRIDRMLDWQIKRFGYWPTGLFWFLIYVVGLFITRLGS